MVTRRFGVDTFALRLRLGSLVLGSALAVAPAQAAIFTVDSTGDQADLAIDGTCDVDPGAPIVCTLRAAIQEANAAAGADTISFNIAPAGSHTIVISTALPTITSPVTIDGTTQPGWVAAGSYPPVIELTATASIGTVLDLRAGSSMSTIRGLCINGSTTSDAIRIQGSSSNVIAGNFLGTNLAGNAPGAGPGNLRGVYIGGSLGNSDSNRIGGTVPADRNIISGNSNDGVQINAAAGNQASNNLVPGNYIGVDVTGTVAVPNGGQGISIFGFGPMSGNVFGGTVPGAGNVISGNSQRGVAISRPVTTGTLVQGNKIGTNAAGTAGIPNGQAGVRFDNSASNNTIGGTAAGAPNIIAYNLSHGVRFTAAAGTGNAILRNQIYSNGALGIDLNEDGVTANDAAPDGDTGPNTLQNYPVLSAAQTNGLGTFANFAGHLNSAASTTYTLEFFANAAADPLGFGEGERYLGTTNVTTNAAGTVTFGVTLAVNLAAGEFVTATATSPSNSTSEFSAAVQAYGSLIVTTTADTVDGNTTSVAALIQTPGADGRISLREAIEATNATGGLDTIRFGIPPIPGVKTIVLGSALPAITSPVTLDGTTQPGWVNSPPYAPVIEVNAAAGGLYALDLQAGSSGSTIRGLCINRASVVAIRVYGSSNNVVAGNFVGTNPAGAAPGPGNAVGIVLGGASPIATNNNRIGGTAAADRNVISGNTVDGIQIEGGTGGAASNRVEGNYIGVDVNGTADLGNTSQGVAVFANGVGASSTNTLVGGTAAGAGNVISGNNGHGILIGSRTTGTVVQGNKVGTNAAGTAAIPNTGAGMRFDGSPAPSTSTIGGTAANEANIIAYNGSQGIRYTGAGGVGHAILRNAIHSNGGVGIDLNADGVTANDALDADSGPNGLLNFPQITSVFDSGGTLTVHFRLDVPAGSYRIEFFKNPSGADPTTFGEGQVFASSTNVTHPGGGAIFFNHSFAGTNGDVIAATTTTCTDGATCAAFGSTSEFAKVMSATTAVELLSFTAVGRDGAVDLFWETASELQNLGFHLYRADSAGGPYARFTSSLIPGLGSSPTGRSYSYRDSGLINGRTYYYQLEDVETRGGTERHGPVSAKPVATAGGPDEPPDPTDGGTPNGDPSSVLLRELERSPSHVVLELRTGGFFASPAEDGRVRLRIPGFESLSRPGEPALPGRRAFVEAASGRKVSLAWVLASDALRFPGLRPVSQGKRGIEVSEDGTVRASEEKRREGPGFERLFPSESALLLGTSFQGEQKKAEVLLFPLRWDGSGLTLSRRLLVRLEFAGVEAQETSRGGSRGRRQVERPSHARTGVVAQITVKEKGLYRVDYEELFDAAPGQERRRIPASSLRLSRQGRDVAFHLEPSGAPFGPGSSLYFLSEGSSLNRYADAVYELETSASGPSMGEETLPPSTSRSVSEYLNTVRKEENHYYQSGLLDAPDLWQWDLVVSPGSKAFAFATEGLTASSLPGRLTVVLQGVSDFPEALDHHVKVSVNGVFVGETTWDGATEETMEMDVPSGAFLEGGNSLQIENVGDAGASTSMVFLNRFSVSYPRRLVAVQGTLEGRFARAGFAEIEGASASSFVLDTTDVPRWLRGASMTPNGLGVPVEAGRSYLVTSSVLRPVVKRLSPSRLKSATNRADYLLVGPQAFLAAAQPLLDLRESQGLLTKAVSLEEVYEQFGHGEVSPQAIKEFLEHAYHFWTAPSLRYVLLLGDASYDPKDNLRTGVRDWLPGFPVRTSYLWTVSDPAYASVNGEDLLPDLAIGRLPAGSVDEAQRLVQKIIAYENGGGSLDGSAVLVADDSDLAGNFEANANELASTLLASRNPTKIYYSVEGPNTRAKIREAFDGGASLMSYVGHGGTAVWASENIFNYHDVTALQAQPRQPLLLTLNCLNGFFQFPPLNSLSEALLKAEGKGVVSAFSPSGLSVNEPAHLFHKALLTEILSGPHERIGDAVLAAQEAYAQSGAFPELLSIYHLLGDPALRIR
jgi:CSLREA domain-containing protein